MVAVVVVVAEIVMLVVVVVVTHVLHNHHHLLQLLGLVHHLIVHNNVQVHIIQTHPLHVIHHQQHQQHQLLMQLTSLLHLHPIPILRLRLPTIPQPTNIIKQLIQVGILPHTPISLLSHRITMIHMQQQCILHHLHMQLVDNQ